MSSDHTPEVTATAARLRYLVPGLQLRLSDLTDTLGGYATSIVEREGRQLWIGIPIRRDGMLTLSVGQLVSARFDRPADAVYLFDSVVADIRDDDVAPYALAEPVTINRRSHRADVRLALVLDATYVAHGVTSVGKVVDLSAGGLGLICASELQAGDIVTIAADLPGPDHSVRIERDVEVRTKLLYGRAPSGATLWQYGLRFLDLDDVAREQVLSSVIWNLTRNPEVL